MATFDVVEGGRIFVASKEEVWAGATVISSTSEGIQAKLDNGEMVTITKAEDYCISGPIDEEPPDDLTTFTHLNDAVILQSLHDRFNKNTIYTFTGSILIAVNPFKPLPGVFNDETLLDFMREKISYSTYPHVYSTAMSAYQGLCSRDKSQTILISGESGAGKTESTKHVMKFLACMGSNDVTKRSKVEQQALESNPLLEAFGNACTVRNYNSSRFGKFIELQYIKLSPKIARICGAKIYTYLLEKVRVCSQQAGERNYHIFYQCCVAASMSTNGQYQMPMTEKYKSRGVQPMTIDMSNFNAIESYTYLTKSGITKIPQIDDIECFEDTVTAMRTIGITPAEMNTYFNIIAAILNLGNILFEVNAKCSEGAVVNSEAGDYVSKVCELLEIDAGTLLNCLLSRTIKTAHETYNKPLRVDEAVVVRDTISRTLYSALFDEVVARANNAIGYREDSTLICGVLDIFGFECFKKNSFEQLCINYTNETLQQYFNQFVFKCEEKLYASEGISWNALDFPDNSDCVELFSEKRTGLFAMLDEECKVPGGNDRRLTSKLCQKYKTHRRFAAVKVDPDAFVINHFAGPVTYSTFGFIDKNKDKLMPDMLTCIMNSRNDKVRAIMSPLVVTEKKGNVTISGQFKSQLDSLMEMISLTEPHFIRCIRPNGENVPDKFDRKSVSAQLMYSGMLQVVKVSRAGYPVRLKHSEFIVNYRMLAPDEIHKAHKQFGAPTNDEIYRKHSEMLMNNLAQNFLKSPGWGIGKTLVFMKNHIYDSLSVARQKLLAQHCVVIQKYMRGILARKAYKDAKYKIVTIQIWIRYMLKRIKIIRLRRLQSAIRLQTYYRMYKCRVSYAKLVQRIVRLESVFRRKMWHITAERKRIYDSASRIQAYYKGILQKRLYKALRHAAVKAQLLWKGKLARRRLRELRMEAKSVGNLITKMQELTDTVKEEKVKAADAEARVLQLNAKIAKLTQEVEALTKENKELKEKCAKIAAAPPKVQYVPTSGGSAKPHYPAETPRVKWVKSTPRQETGEDVKGRIGSRPYGDLVLLGPPKCGKSILIENLLKELGDDDNLKLFQSLSTNAVRPGRTGSLVSQAYDIEIATKKLRLVEMPWFCQNTPQGREILLKSHLICIVFDPTVQNSMQDALKCCSNVLKITERCINKVVLLESLCGVDMFHRTNAYDVTPATEFATNNQIDYISKSNLHQVIMDLIPFFEKCQRVKKFSTQYPDDSNVFTKSSIATFYDKLRSLWSGPTKSSEDRFLLTSLTLPAGAKTPCLNLQHIIRISNYKSAVTCMAFRPENPEDPFVLLAVARRDGMVNLYECYRTATERHNLLRAACGVDEDARSDSGQYPSANIDPKDDQIQITESFKLLQHTKAVTCMVFAPLNPNELITTSVDSSIRAWNVQNGTLIRVFNDSSPTLAISFYPLFPTHFVSSNANSVIRLVAYNQGMAVQKIKTKSEVRCLMFDDIGLNCLAGSERGSIYVYEASADPKLTMMNTKYVGRGAITCITFISANENNQSPCILVNCCNMAITIMDCIYDQLNSAIIDLVQRHVISNNQVALPIRSTYSRFGGGWCISGSEDSNVLLFSLSDDHVPFSIRYHQGHIVAVAVNALDTILATSDTKGVIVLWRRVCIASEPEQEMN